MRTRRGMILLCGTALIAAGGLPPGRAAAGEPLPGVFIEAGDLTAAEMRQVRRLVGPTGKEPWLIYGFRFGAGAKSVQRQTSLEIYLEPDVVSGSLRRGRVLHLETAPPGAGDPASWRTKATGAYAHVAVLGRGPGEVRGRWDPHRPFLVDGEFDDGTLRGLVGLIRRSPEAPALPGGQPSGRIDGSLPISYVRRTDEGIEVRLNRGAYNGHYVIVRQHNGRLSIVRYSLWIV